MRADVQRFSLPDPGNVEGLRQAIESGAVDPARIVAVIGKTHGNGLVNDYTRGYLAQSLALLIAEKLETKPDAVRQRIPFIFSGGVEGVLSPHYSVFSALADNETGTSDRALAIGVAFTPDFQPEDIGRQRQIDLTAEAVRHAMHEASIGDAADVHFVQVKGPAFTQADIRDAQARGKLPASDNPGKLMGFGRAASALGIARALGETDGGEADVLSDFSKFSSIASCSAGVEVRCNEVVVLGMSREWSGRLSVSHAPMRDALDTAGVRAALRDLGFADALQLPPDEAARIRSGFVKCEASPDGVVRGKPHTMLNDGDIDQQRHIRAAVGAVVASVVGDTALFVSGGAEHQGPAGGGIVAFVAQRL